MMNDLRTAKLNGIIEWARNNDVIRAGLLTSSLTNPHAPVDRFSDLDIELVVTDLDAFLADNSWLNRFGTVISMVAEGVEAFDGRNASRMVLYEDHCKIDFLIFSANQFSVETAKDILPEDWDIGYKVLLDKDGLTNNMKPPTYKAFIIQKPTNEAFQRIMNDFWWDTTYVAKCLLRGELFYLRFMTEKVIRFDYFQQLLEWHIAAEHNWTITTNKYGRLFKQYLTADTWQRIEATFAGSGTEENWKALYVYMDLFSELGQKLASQLGYSYPAEHEQKIRKYLAEVRAGFGLRVIMKIIVKPLTFFLPAL